MEPDVTPEDAQWLEADDATRPVPDDDDDAAWVEPRPEPAEEPDHLTDEPGTP